MLDQRESVVSSSNVIVLEICRLRTSTSISSGWLSTIVTDNFLLSAILCFCTYEKQGFLDLLSLADRTSAGFFQPLAFSEDKAAFQAFRRDYRQLMSGRMRGTFDMRKMFKNVLFRDMHLAGDLFCGKRLVLQDCKDLSPDCLMPFHRHERLFGLLSLHHVFL